MEVSGSTQTTQNRFAPQFLSNEANKNFVFLLIVIFLGGYQVKARAFRNRGFQDEGTHAEAELHRHTATLPTFVDSPASRRECLHIGWIQGKNSLVRLRASSCAILGRVLASYLHCFTKPPGNLNNHPRPLVRLLLSEEDCEVWAFGLWVEPT